jgi:putative ABC transport system permease protein
VAIRTIDVVRSVRHTFKTSKLRVGLTLLGIMIGSGAMVLLAGLLVAGEEALVRLSQGANESDMITLHNADAPKKDAHKTTHELTSYDADALEDSALLGGAQVSSAGRKQTKVYFGTKEKAVTLFAGEHDALELYRVSVEKGRYFSDDDFRHRARVAVVGQEVWTELLEKKDLTNADGGGLHITIDGQVFEVVGALAHKPTMSHGNGTWMWNRRVMIPSTTYNAVFEPGHKVGAVFVRLKDQASLVGKARQLTDVVEQTILRRHNNVKNFEIESDARGQDQEELILKIIEILLFGTGVVALFVGGINIMNIMLVTVTERTKEIGIRRAVGATPAEISRQFVIEAGVLAGAGGILGVVGGISLTWLLSVILTKVLAPWRFDVELWSIGLALTMAIGTGVIFGLFPALRAAKLDPVMALRSE